MESRKDEGRNRVRPSSFVKTTYCFGSALNMGLLDRTTVGVVLPCAPQQPGSPDPPEHRAELRPKPLDEELPAAARTVARARHLRDLLQHRRIARGALLPHSALPDAEAHIVKPESRRQIHKRRNRVVRRIELNVRA